MAFSEGTLVSGYRVAKVLGSGGMGTVYLAANPVLPRDDALKVLGAELSRDPSFRARFLREADLAATLTHPNIVTVYTRGETEDGQLWIAMQYVPGSDALKELREHRMTAQRALHITAEVAKALDYAHRRNLVHRDVKPANFLLDDDGERVFLADFGIARALDDSEGLTLTGTVMATVAYAAPETLGGGRIDGRADIYALGCSLFMMLTGTTPFASAGGLQAVMLAHLYHPPPRITDHAPHLPAALNDVIGRAMAKNPADRFQTAREFADAAAAALHGGHGVAGTAPPLPTAGWPVPQGPTDRAITYPSDPQPQMPYAPPPPVPVRPPRRRRGVVLAVLATVLIVVAAGLTAFLWPREDGTAYAPQQFTHAHGTTDIAARPTRVAALGPGDGDAVLNLGVQPALVVAPNSTLPVWDQQLVTQNPTLIPAVEPDPIAGVKPDVIIATGDVDDATYAKLAAIAPTVTRPANTTTWGWRDQVTWIGRILGRENEARRLLDSADARQSDLRAQHPAFDGKTIEVVNVSDAGISMTLGGSGIADYLESLGFRYTDSLDRSASDTGDVRTLRDPDELTTSQTDVRIVVRTDQSAYGGGYNGLAPQFTRYRGATVIVDDPEVIAAMNAESYGAVAYLDNALVDALARQVH